MTTLRQGTIGKGLKGLTSHQDRMPCSERLEALEVSRQVPEQVIPLAYSSILGHSHDYRE